MHTPTPWAIGSMDDGLWITGPDTKENVICDLVGRNSRYKFTAEDEANAAFIVTACNAHDALVAACSNVMQRLDWAVGYQALDSRLSPQQMLELADTLRVALALAAPKEAVR